MTEDEKKCPQCAEIVKQDAVICRFCRYDFAEGRSSGERPTPHKVFVGPQKNSFQSCMGCLGIAILVLLFLTQVPAPG